MDHFTYKNGKLYAENVDIKDIAEEVGTPFYCYSTATLLRHYKVFADGFSSVDSVVCFAVKANSNLAVLKTLAKAGAGGDCVSEGEIRRCLVAGINPNKIVFSGVGKKTSEMNYALENDILQINVESLEELDQLNNVAVSLGKKANIAFRVNPDVDAGSHDKISTGRKEDKFGIAWDIVFNAYEIAAKLPGINVQGVAMHIGSQLISLDPLRKAFEKAAILVKSLREKGHNITHLDLGGGLGIPYEGENPPSPEDYAKMVLEVTKDLNCKLMFEPGRLIAGNSGILVSDVIFVKKTDHRNFLIVDAAMNDLIRPAMYGSYHDIIPVNENNGNRKPIDIVGPVCETGDIFAKQRELPEIKAGELIAIRSSGAYGAVMTSEYNTRPMIPEVLVNDSDFAVIRKRPSYDEILKRDHIPNWL